MKLGEARKYAPWLWLLAGLFFFRVIAQPLALVDGMGFLPDFESWHGGVLSYPLLLGTQLLILIWLVVTASRFTANAVMPNRRLGILMLGLGSLYFSIMSLRLVLGATLLIEQRWFASPLPTFFHLVLAAFLLLYGHYHYNHEAGGPT